MLCRFTVLEAKLFVLQNFIFINYFRKPGLDFQIFYWELVKWKFVEDLSIGVLSFSYEWDKQGQSLIYMEIFHELGID